MLPYSNIDHCIIRSSVDYSRQLGALSPSSHFLSLKVSVLCLLTADDIGK